MSDTNTKYAPSPFSRVTLGTVQFGLKYGIANESGQPDYTVCRDIVAEALAAGIRTFDTAAEYGESEAVLGRIFADLGVAEQVTVVSKCRHMTMEGLTEVEIEATIESSLRQSLKHLRMERLPLFMLHREEDLAGMEALARFREHGWIERAGISVNTPEGARAAAEHPLAEAVQIPVNLFDHRFSGAPFFQRMVDRGVAIFARSAFLQGLLLMPEARVPAPLRSVLPARRELEALARDSGMTMAELCLRYCLSMASVTSVLIGVDSVAQLRENIAMIERGPLEPEIIARARAVVPDFPDTILWPKIWPKT